jgi:hypothetical protein
MGRRRPLALALACAAVVALAGCGGGGEEGGGARSPNARAAPASPEIVPAQQPRRAAFPAPDGRTLRQLAAALAPGPQVALATSVHAPGRARVAFGLIEPDNRFLYAPTAVYVAARPDAPARGPFLAPADSLEVRPAFRSRTSNSTDGELKAIYRTEVPLPRAGQWLLLAVSERDGRLVGATAPLAVRDHPRIPDIGDPAPRVATPTLADVGGDAAAIDTREPPSDMHRVSLADVLGRRPVALLFATPALCQSRVCGPVADIGAQLQAAYGDRVEFIHNEVYVDNEVAKGLRPQLTAFGLTTEPWLFAIDRDGRVAARLEGAFGVDEYRDAVERAIAGAGR